jgi:gliding motility-associated lipoprotein GldH
MKIMLFKSHILKGALYSLGFLVLISCSNKQTTEQYKVFSEQKWNTDSIVVFSLNNKDSITPQDIVLKIRHSTEYKFQNLYVFTLFRGSLDTVEIVLSEKNGKWLGKGFGDAREIDVILRKNDFLETNSKNKIIIEQAMRYGDSSEIENLDGVIAIGISTHKTNE